MKLNYKQRLFLYFAIIFSVFTIGVIAFGQLREKRFKAEILEEKLDTYTEIVNASLIEKTENYTSVLDSVLRVFPDNIRLSLIDTKGVVQFDNSIENVDELENHNQRLEIQNALQNGKGTNIRISTSNHQAYLYYAKKFENYFIRMALPYDAKTQHFLKANNGFLIFIILFFLIILLWINITTNRFGKTIKQLRDFALATTTNSNKNYNFPNDELGEISSMITENYRKLKENQKEIALEREKLLQHIHTSEEGICFFSKHRKVEFINGLFLQYLNILIDEPSRTPSVVFSATIFDEMNQFLVEKSAHYFETQITKQAKIFSLRVNVFEDFSFEIILNDITRQERTRQLKQEMTSNIAHELRTPLTSIRGYLETALSDSLDEKKRSYFMQQAYNQSILLSGIVQDMGLITRMGEAPNSFLMEEVDITQMLENLKRDFAKELAEKDIKMTWSLPESLRIKANPNLLYSIFRNLLDNTIRYAGKTVDIHVSLYNRDAKFYYFSYSDTGIGITEESHLNRLFERFYRINEGRTRDTGGTGLGLSIVKNAIAFHKGKIIAKNKKEGGLEFLFQIMST